MVNADKGGESNGSTEAQNIQNPQTEASYPLQAGGSGDGSMSAVRGIKTVPPRVPGMRLLQRKRSGKRLIRRSRKDPAGVLF